MLKKNRVGRWLMLFAPTLTSATLVPVSRPPAHSRNIAYGTPQARSGRLASSTPMPGTITASCLRTQRTVRPASTSLPSTRAAADGTPSRRPSNCLAHCSGTAASPYRAVS